MSIERKGIVDRIRTRDLRVLDRGPTAYTISHFLHYALRATLGRKVPRDHEWIHDEYQITKRFDWRPNLTFDDLVHSDDRIPKWILDEGRLRIGTERTVRLHLLSQLEQRILQFLPDGRGTVIEFGCGTGRNLFHLARTFPQLQLIGIELTPSTAEYARSTGRSAGLAVTIHTGDMTADWSLLHADVAFSVHAIEQLTYTFGKAIDNMASVARKGIVLFEPIRELYPWTLRGLAARFRNMTANYPKDLMRYVRRKPELKIEQTRILPSGNPVNPTIEVVASIVGR
jgi:SAM-dependent methyltransferase